MARILGALELTLDKTVLPAAVGLQSQAAVGPQLPFGAKAMGRLNQSDQQSRPNRSDRRNLAQPLHRAVLATLGQQILPYLLAQNNQRIELPVVELGSAAHDPARLSHWPEREESTRTSTTAVFVCSAKSCFIPLSTRELVEHAEVASCGTHLANDLAGG